MSITIKAGPLVIAWRPATDDNQHTIALCTEVSDWLVDRAIAAEVAFETERSAHAHLLRCRDFDCGIYRLMVDQAVDAASVLIDEMETTDA